jgi:cell division protease FtsH
LLFLAIFQVSRQPPDSARQVSFSYLLSEVRKGTVRDMAVTLRGEGQAADFRATDGEGHALRTTGVLADSVLQLLEEQQIGLRVRSEESSLWTSALASWVPMLVLIALFVLFMRQLQKRGGSSIDDLKQIKVNPSRAERQRLAAVANAPGVWEAKNVLLRQIAAIKRKPPAPPLPCLLSGPPGCGKTLLLQALGGEAGLPVLAVSGMDFVHVFVGIGASRMHDLFQQARRQAPCIVCIDQLDSLAKARAAQTSNERHDEREQTLHKLLQEVDALIADKQPILVVAATDRPELLDDALLKGGRFGFHLRLELPDEPGRREILGLLTAGQELGPDVDLARLAVDTPGWSGAELRNLVLAAIERAEARPASEGNRLAMADFVLSRPC